MISLCMDTAYKALVVGIYKDSKLLKGISIEAFKKQSESLFVEMNALLKACDLTYKDVDRIVITKGPGSYTGIRIAMTVAKVLASQLHIELCTISTMQLYAGLETCNVLLDARSKRAYVAYVKDGHIEGKTQILPIDQLQEFIDLHPGKLVGDGYLVNQEGSSVDFLKNFIDLEPVYEHVDNVHALVPDYLKESDAYKA